MSFPSWCFFVLVSASLVLSSACGVPEGVAAGEVDSGALAGDAGEPASPPLDAGPGRDAGSPDAGKPRRDGGSQGPDAGSPRGDGGMESEFLAAHNAARANASPAPSPPLSPLTWNPAAAAVAQAWASGCRFEHNPELRKYPYGENLYAETGSLAAPAQAVRSWASEASDYDWTANRCAPGKVCGHYTQLVWRKTSSVGCAVAVCDANSPFGGGRWSLVVCDYAPPGNYVGQRPY